jgi:hypothetical protein
MIHQCVIARVAETLARSITDPDPETYALTALAQTLAGIGQALKATRLAAVACQVSINGIRSLT